MRLFRAAAFESIQQEDETEILYEEYSIPLLIRKIEKCDVELLLKLLSERKHKVSRRKANLGQHRSFVEPQPYDPWCLVPVLSPFAQYA